MAHLKSGRKPHFAVRKNKFEWPAASSDSCEEPTVDSDRSVSPRAGDESIRLHQIRSSVELLRESLMRKKEKTRKLNGEIASLQEKADKNEESFAYLKDAHRQSKKNESVRELLKHKAVTLNAGIARLKERLADAGDVFQRGAALRQSLQQAKGQGLESLSLREVQGLAQNAVATLQRLQAAVTEKCERLTEGDVCGVCLTRRKTEITVPCGHFVLCLGCLSACLRCPVCRARIEHSYSC